MMRMSLRVIFDKYLKSPAGRRPELSGIVFLSCALLTAIFVIYIIYFIFATAFPVFQKEGIGFITGSVWNYNDHVYGIFVYIMGTLIMTFTTMIIACPLSILTAIYLAEFAPARVNGILRPMIELLVGIPSVVYGIFGLFVLSDVFAAYVDPMISGTLGFIPIFHDPNPGRSSGVLLASTVLAVMVLPTITVLSVEALRAVPREYHEASYAVGGTKWDTILKMALPVASSGIITAIVLGIMRAMGETMAIVMLMGNSDRIPASVFDIGYAMTSKILNDMGYYIADNEGRSALFGMAAVLFLIEVVFVAAIRLFGVKRDRSLLRTAEYHLKGVVSTIRRKTP